MFRRNLHRRSETTAGDTPGVEIREAFTQPLKEFAGAGSGSGGAKIESSARRRLGRENEGRNEQDLRRALGTSAGQASAPVGEDPKGQEEARTLPHEHVCVLTGEAHLDQKSRSDGAERFAPAADRGRAHALDEKNHEDPPRPHTTFRG